MERKKIDAFDNASLMSFVKDARGLFKEAFENNVENTPVLWESFHNLRYAESLMKFRNLPLDDERLGKRIDVKAFRDYVSVPTENQDQENGDSAG
jgi:hypothetical protein